MKIGKWLKRRLFEPSTAASLAALAATIGGPGLSDTVNEVIAAVGGVLVAIGVITPENTHKEEG